MEPRARLGPVQALADPRADSLVSPERPQQIRIMRANLLDELRKPYVVTARSKGLSEMRVIVKYPVRMALNPFASTIGYTLPYIVSGSIIVSLVSGYRPVGPLLLKALISQDMFLAGTIVLLLGIMTVIGTLISDIVLVWIDRASGSRTPDGRRRRCGAAAERADRGQAAHFRRLAVAAHVVAVPEASRGRGQRHRRRRLLSGPCWARTSSRTPTPTRPRRSAP